MRISHLTGLFPEAGSYEELSSQATEDNKIDAMKHL